MNLPADARRALVICLGVFGLAALAALTASWVWSPAEMAAGAPLALAGIPQRVCPGCPLCGMSRAFAAFSRLELDQALAFNRGVLFAYPAAALLAVAGPMAFVAELFQRRRS